MDKNPGHEDVDAVFATVRAIAASEGATHPSGTPIGFYASGFTVQPGGTA